MTPRIQPPPPALPPLTPARSADVHHLLDRVHHVEAMTLLAALPDASVQLVAVDPPYNGVKDDAWDNQWRDDDEFIAWMGALCREWRRVLTPNGSLYVFASPRLAARVEVEIGRWFNVLNRITWSKPKFSTKAEMFDKDTMRAYFPASEAIIFAEQFAAEQNIKDADYALWGRIINPLRFKLRDLTLPHKDALIDIYATDGRYTTHGSIRVNAGRQLGWLPTEFELMTEAIFQRVQSIVNPGMSYEDLRREYEDLRREYEDLRREYEDLRREYEDLRRPFNSHPFAPYTDVWDFPTVGAYEGKHPAEKPLAMMEHIVKISSRPGDIVVDCFCGSGTTLDAARRNDRHYIGGDFTAHWADYSRRRVSLPYNVRLPFEEAV